MVGKFELSVPPLTPLLGFGHGLDHHG